MSGKKLYIDFETRSAVNLPACGVHVYAEHESTDILCLGWAFDDEPIRVAKPHQVPPEVYMHVMNERPVVAHNVQFELAIWNSAIGQSYFYYPLLPETCSCTMTRALAMALPGSLEHAAAAVGIQAQKDMAGRRLMLKMSSPKRVKESYADDEDPYEWHEEPEQFERLFAYCAQDIEVERQLDKRLMKLSKSEFDLWLLDQEINNRGTKIDTVAAAIALDIVDKEQDRLHEEMRKVTGNRVATCTAHQQLKVWVNEQGIETEGVDKNAVLEILARKDISNEVRSALLLRQESAKSSTRKLKAMLDRSGFDGRLRGGLQFHAASTGRWGGRGLQLQNFPRPSMPHEEIESVMAAFHKGWSVDDIRDYIELLHGSPMKVISSCLRAFLIADFGKDLIAIDWNAIEARILAWLAGEEDDLVVFRTHGKIYEKAAGIIFGVDWRTITKTDPRRQIGKVAVLALGYQGGVGAMQTMARSNQVVLAPVLENLWQLADLERRERCMLRWKQQGKKSGVEKREWFASELIKLAWREAHSNIVSYWSLVEQAAICAVKNPGKVFEAPYVKYRMKGSFLFCQLPSGRFLTYPYPKVELRKTPWDTMKEMIVYSAEDSQTHKWGRVKTYGGSLVENIVQAVARDILAHGMFEFKKIEIPIVFTVHDELVGEIDEDTPDTILGIAEKIVAVPPAWAEDLPLKAEGWRGKRYRK